MRNRTRLLVLLTAVLMLIPSGIYPQHEGKARLKGVISDTEGNPLADVKVKLFSLRAASGFETKTGKDGVWKAMWIRGGKWNIDFEKPGYEPKKISVSLKEDSKIITIETTLKRIKGPSLKQELMKDFEKGNRLFSEGKIDNALEIYENILEKFPDAYVIYLNIGNCYFEKQEYEKAILVYQKIVEKEPQHTDALISIGNSYSNMKQPDKALEWYKKIEITKIDDPVVLYNIGVFNFNAGSIKTALRFFKRSVEVKGDFTDGWYQLGMSYMSNGDNDAAISSFEAYLKYDSESEKAKQVREILKALKQ
jgi:tetratricopeptide (TPR) repeat protein